MKISRKVIVSLIILLVILVITTVILRQQGNDVDSTQDDTTIQTPLKTKAEISAENYIKSLDTDFTIKSANTIYEEGDFAVINIERSNGQWTISGPAVTKRGEVIIPPNMDYEHISIDEFNIPNSVMNAMKEAGGENS